MLTAPTEKLENDFCWIRALGVTAASFITDYRIQVGINMTSHKVTFTQLCVAPEDVCDVIREQFSKTSKSRFMMNWIPLLRDIGLKPRMVKFVVPDSIETFDDAINKVIGQEWKKRLEEWESELVSDLCKSEKERAEANGEDGPIC